MPKDSVSLLSFTDYMTDSLPPLSLTKTSQEEAKFKELVFTGKEPDRPAFTEPKRDYKKNLAESFVVGFGDDKGKVDYLKKIYDDATLNKQGQLVVKEDGTWKFFNRPGPSFSDIGNIPGHSIVPTGQTLGGVGGAFLASGGGPPGMAGGAAVGGGAGGALSELLRQAVGKKFGTQSKYDIGSIGTEALLGASTEGIGAGIGALLAKKTLAKGAQEVAERTTKGLMKETAEEAFPTYQKQVLAGIKKADALPTIKLDVADYKPKTMSFQNPYTKNAYKVWDSMSELYEKKAPDFLKTFPSKDMEILTKERQRLTDGWTAKLNEDLVSRFNKIPKEEQKRVGEMMFKIIPVEDQYKELIKESDVAVGQLSLSFTEKKAKWAKMGFAVDQIITPEEIIKENVGKYYRTAYIQPEGKIKPGGGFNKLELNRSMFRKKLTDYEWGMNSLIDSGMSEKEALKMAKDEVAKIGLEAKHANGWVTQADAVASKTYKDMIDNYATMEWQDTIVNLPNKFSKTAKPGMIKVDDIAPSGFLKEIATEKGAAVVQLRNRRLGPLAGGYVSPDVAEEIKNMLTIPHTKNAFETIMGEGLSWWKAMKVAGDTATPARNYVSGGVVQTDMAGFPVWTPKNAKTYVNSLKDYFKKGDRYKFWRNNGLYGSDYFSVEIDPADLKAITGSANPMSEFGAKALKTSQKGKKIFSYYGAIDHLHRTYLAEAALKDGASPEQAVYFANKWQLDYRFVPKWADFVRKKGGAFFPFISFQTLMVPRTAEVLMTRPWVLAKYPVMVKALDLYSRNKLGLDKEERDEALPDYLGDSSYSALLPYSDGEYNFLNIDYTLPFGGPETLFQDYKMVADSAGSGGLVGIMLGLNNNYDNFTEKPIWDKDAPKAVQDKKKWAYIYRNLGPGIIGRIGRIREALEGKLVGFPEPNTRNLNRELLKAVGISTYPVNKNALFYKAKAYERNIKDLMFLIKKTASDRNMSQENMDEIVDQAVDLIDEKGEKLGITLDLINKIGIKKGGNE